MTTVLRDLKNKITGADKYQHNLLGESLPDLLRRATAKSLVTPDEEINQQVVETIQQEVAGGRDTKDIVSLLKKRLRSDNPQKQFLAVHLVEKVMAECSNVLGLHQEELLQEVAKVMAKPSKPETDAGKAARNAAKELLRKCGRAGNNAFRNAQRDMYGAPLQAMHAAPHGAATGYPAGTMPYGYTGGPDYAPGARADGGMSIERQSLAEEINLLIDKARSNSELLSDMLVNSTGGADEFEKELISDLLQEVKELRGLFTAYLEQLQTVDGEDMELLMVQALEAVDLLDGVIALHKDVAGDQHLPSEGGATSPKATTGYHGSLLNYQLAGQPAAAAAAAQPAAAAPQPAKGGADLIDLLDGPAEPAPQPVAVAAAAPAYDPFAASNAAPLFGAAPTPDAAPASAAAPKMTSAFESMFAHPGGQTAAVGASLAAAAPAAAPAPAPQPVPQPVPQAGYAQGPFGAPAPAYAPTPGYGGYGTMGANPFGAPMAAQAPQNPYGAPAAAQANPFGGFAPPQNPYGAPAPAPPANPFGAAAPPGGNPFGAPAAAPAMGYGMPQGMQQAPVQNPFGGAPVPAQGAAVGGAQPSLDQEWDMFFANRATGGPGAGNTQQVHADFDALVKPTAAR